MGGSPVEAVSRGEVPLDSKHLCSARRGEGSGGLSLRNTHWGPDTTLSPVHTCSHLIVTPTRRLELFRSPAFTEKEAAWQRGWATFPRPHSELWKQSPGLLNP